MKQWSVPVIITITASALLIGMGWPQAATAGGCCYAPPPTATQSASIRPSARPSPRITARDLRFKVMGRTCNRCDESIKNALMKLPGITNVRFQRDTVVVTANSSVAIRQVIDAIGRPGGERHTFSAVPLDVELVRLQVSGMTRESGSASATQALQSVACVVSADVSYEKSEAAVVVERGCSDPTPLISSLSRAGLSARAKEGRP